MSRLNLLVLLGFVTLCLAVGFTAGQLTAPNIPFWYAGLAKPSFNPPNWVFAPVWSTLYLLMAVAGWLVWRKTGWKSPALGLWAVQLGLNFAWSFIFFAAHALGAALAELSLLWLAILACLIAFWRIERPAGWLLAPYLFWVSYAGVLNFSLWRLNPG